MTSLQRVHYTSSKISMDDVARWAATPIIGIYYYYHQYLQEVLRPNVALIFSNLLKLLHGGFGGISWIRQNLD